ncbi:MAG: SprT family zinc-dependent metalloprotease [Bacteroidales bacterium]|nr:SprT family zinc-dependent metalloprotease [Bacteroidales bacterium]
MKEDQTIFFDEIGNVKFRYNRRARRYGIHVKPSGEVCVTIPYLGSLKTANSFVERKKDWIITNLRKIKDLKKPYTTGLILYNELFSVNICLNITNNNTIKISSENGTHFTVLLPSDTDLSEESSQKKIEDTINSLFLKAAKKILPVRVNLISEKTGLHYSGLKITSAKKRWGSCTVRNSINLSKNLVRIPVYLIDFVIIHELCHTVHKNHGAKFHALVNSFCNGQEKQLEKDLKMKS